MVVPAGKSWPMSQSQKTSLPVQDKPCGFTLRASAAESSSEADGRVPVPKLFQKSKYLRKKGFYFERRQIPEIYVRLWKV